MDPCLIIAQELSVEQNIALTIRTYQEKEVLTIKNEDWKETTKWRSRIYKTLTNAKVNPVNLEDQHGELWNLGVLNQPFVVHGISNFGSRLNEMKVAAANVVAEENATNLMTFLLMPYPVNAQDSMLLTSISDKIVVVFMEMAQEEDLKAGDNRLLSLINGYPKTYYIHTSREIAGLQIGVLGARPKTKKIAGVTIEEAHEKNLKVLRKGVRALLRGKKVKWY